MDEEINLQELSIEELLELMMDDLYDGYADEIVAEVNEALGRGMLPYEVLTQGLVAGMEIVGIDFRDGVLFVPEVLKAAKAMKAGMAVLRPLLAETGAPTIGKMVVGTVKGDIHDIGKNLVAMMMEDILLEQGCSPHVVGEQKQALACLEGARFDAAILDVNLNGASSFPIAEVLKARGVPFAFSTGYDEQVVREGFCDQPVLRKPFIPDKLLEVLCLLV